MSPDRGNETSRKFEGLPPILSIAQQMTLILWEIQGRGNAERQRRLRFSQGFRQMTDGPQKGDTYVLLRLRTCLY